MDSPSAWEVSFHCLQLVLLPPATCNHDSWNDVSLECGQCLLVKKLRAEDGQAILLLKVKVEVHMGDIRLQSSHSGFLMILFFHKNQESSKLCDLYYTWF